MVDFFDKLYTSLGRSNSDNKILEKIKFYSIIRFILRLCANIVIPIYFFFTRSNKRYAISLPSNSEKRIVVTLTSFPKRINKVWLVVESILRQERKVDMIILWLSKEQFLSIHDVPSTLVKLQNRGLQIRFCDGDLRSHKKYYYAMKEFSEDYIITLDDDVFYSSKVIKYLVDLKEKYPNVICCNHASKITFKNGEIDFYLNWENVNGLMRPNKEIMPIGVGGVLYPPKSLSSDVFNSDIFMSKCLLADDIWLNVMSRINNTKVAKSAFRSCYLPILFLKNKTLNSENVSLGLNDKQLIDIRNHYIQNRGGDPFKNILK